MSTFFASNNPPEISGNDDQQDLAESEDCECKGSSSAIPLNMKVMSKMMSLQK